jgi:O-antigen biosynthesis protein
MLSPSVTLLILNWNGRALLESCLSALTNLDYPNYAILLVDNASSDDSVAFTRQQFPQVDIICNAENLGFSRGVNVGLQKAEGDIVVLLNNDVVVPTDWLSHLVAPFAQDETVGVVGCKLLFPDGAIQHAGARLNYPLAYSEHFHYREPDIGQADTARDVDYVTGASMAIGRSVLDAIGLLDETFSPFYYEEVDYCYRARAAGFRVVYTPEATAVHYEGSSVSKVSGLHGYTFHKNRLLFVLKHYSAEQFNRDFLPAELLRLQSADGRGQRELVRRVYLERLLATPSDKTAVRQALLQLRQASLLPSSHGYIDAADWPGQELQTKMGFREPQFRSEKALVGPLIVAFRQAWNNVSTRWYVWDLILQQAEYNSLTAVLLDEQNRTNMGQGQEITLLAEEMGQLKQELAGLNRRIARLEAHFGLTLESDDASAIGDAE